jgi:hypothetical protein
LDIKKRQENERLFPNWEELEDGSRVYWFEIKGRIGWKAKYLKQVDDNEVTLKFWQEIYDESGILVEVHEKYPVDKGHKKIEKP